MARSNTVLTVFCVGLAVFGGYAPGIASDGGGSIDGGLFCSLPSGAVVVEAGVAVLVRAFECLLVLPLVAVVLSVELLVDGRHVVTTRQ